MTNLLIRDLDDALHRRLKARARAHRRSLAAEARETLRDAIARADPASSSETLLRIAIRIYGPEHGVEIKLPPRSGDMHRPPPDFSGPEFDR